MNPALTRYRTLSWLEVVALLNNAGIRYAECGVSSQDKSAWASGVVVPQFNRNGQPILNKAGWLLTRLKANGMVMVRWDEVDKTATFVVPEGAGNA
mgnify:CR=1 FL=1